jgi:hypothetical protein
MADTWPRPVELPHEDPSDITKTAIFQELKATPEAPNQLADQRQLQRSFDEVAPQRGESNEHYLAVLSTQAAQYGPEERRNINRLSLPPSALAVVARDDLDFARKEIEHPNHSLKDGEVREVVKQDESGRPITYFYSKQGPSFWMDQFKHGTVKTVSGGLNGFATEENKGNGWYRFDKCNTNPELRAIIAEAHRMDSTEYKIARAYIEAGLPSPSSAEIAKMMER